MSAASTEGLKIGQVLISDLSTLTKQITAYVVRSLDADAACEELPGPSDEQRLGSRMVELGSQLQARASTRCFPAKYPARRITARQRPRETPPLWVNPDRPIYAP